ncbi:MAG: hypothetical protein AB8G18_11760 [Gammaproteobacteria bacterium]
MIALQSIDGTLEMNSSALRDARVEVGLFGSVTTREFFSQSVIFDNIVLAGTMYLSSGSPEGTVNIENGITLDDGVISIGNQAMPLNFVGTQTLSGQGVVSVLSVQEPAIINLPAAQSTLTVEAGIAFEVDENLIINAPGSELVLNGEFEAERNLQITADRIEINNELYVDVAQGGGMESRLNSMVEIGQNGSLTVGCCSASTDLALTVTGAVLNAGLITVTRRALVLTDRFENAGSVDILQGTLKIGDGLEDLWLNPLGVGSLSMTNSDLVVFATFDTENLNSGGSSGSVFVSGRMLNSVSTPVTIFGDIQYVLPLEVVGGPFPNVLAANQSFMPGEGPLVFDGVEFEGDVNLRHDLDVIIRNGLTLKFGSQILSEGSVVTFEGSQTLSAAMNGGTFLWQSSTPLVDDQIVVIAGDSPTLTIEEDVNWTFDLPSALIGSESASIVLNNQLTFKPSVESAVVLGEAVNQSGRLNIESDGSGSAPTVTVNATSIGLGSFALGSNAHLVLNAESVTRGEFLSFESSPIEAGAILDLNSPSIMSFADVEFRVGNSGAGVVNFSGLHAGFQPTWYVAIDDGYSPVTCSQFSIITHPAIDPVNEFIGVNIEFLNAFGMYSVNENRLVDSIDIGVGPLDSCL